MDRVVGPLEQPVLAILDELVAQRILVSREQLLPDGAAAQGLGRHDDRGGDVVLGLDLCRGGEILPHLERPPRAAGLKADAQVGAHQLAVVVLQLVARRAVDDVHAEMLAPAAAPFRR